MEEEEGEERVEEVVEEGEEEEEEEEEEELLSLEGALLDEEDAGCEDACSGPGSRGSIKRAGCVGG